MPSRIAPLSLVVIVLLAAGCHVDVCKSVNGTCLAVHVASAQVSIVDQLQLDTTIAGSAPLMSRLTPAQPKTQSLPIDVALAFAHGQAGVMHIDLSGLRNGKVIGFGSANVTLAAGKHQTVDITLAPGSGEKSAGRRRLRRLARVRQPFPAVQRELVAVLPADRLHRVHSYAAATRQLQIRVPQQPAVRSVAGHRRR